MVWREIPSRSRSKAAKRRGLSSSQGITTLLRSLNVAHRASVRLPWSHGDRPSGAGGKSGEPCLVAGICAPWAAAGSARRAAELRQHRGRPFVEEQVLLGPDLLDEQLVHAGLGIRAQRLDVLVDVRTDRRDQVLGPDQLAGLFEVRWRGEDLRELAGQRLVRPQPVRRAPRLILV